MRSLHLMFLTHNFTTSKQVYRKYCLLCWTLVQGENAFKSSFLIAVSTQPLI